MFTVVMFSVFSTSDRIYQMCYWCRKLEKLLFSQFCEAVCEGARPDWLRQSTASLGEQWEADFERWEADSDSLGHGLPHFLMWSVWANQRSCSLGLPQPLTTHGLSPHTASHGQRVRSANWTLLGKGVRSSGQSDWFHVRESDRWPHTADRTLLDRSHDFAVRGWSAPLTPTASHGLYRVRESDARPIRLSRTNHMTLRWEADRHLGLPRPPMDSTRWESPIGPRIGLPRPVESEVPIGLSPQSHVGLSDH